MNILIQTLVIKHIHDSTMNIWLIIGTISNFENDFGWQFGAAPYKFELLLKHSKKFPLVFGGLIIHEYPSYRRRDIMPISRHKNLHPHALWSTYVSVHDNAHLLLNCVYQGWGTLSNCGNVGSDACPRALMLVMPRPHLVITLHKRNAIIMWCKYIMICY